MAQQTSNLSLMQSVLTNIYCVVTTDKNKYGQMEHDVLNETIKFYGSSQKKMLQQLKTLYPNCISILISTSYPTLHLALSDRGNIKCIIHTINNNDKFKNLEKYKCSAKESDDLLNHIASIERIRVYIKYEMSLPIKSFMALMKNGFNSMSQINELAHSVDLNKTEIMSIIEGSSESEESIGRI